MPCGLSPGQVLERLIAPGYAMWLIPRPSLREINSTGLCHVGLSPGQVLERLIAPGYAMWLIPSYAQAKSERD